MTKRPSDCEILIVDDDEIVCDMLKQALGSTYKVFACHNGADAYQLMNVHDFDVIVTDLKLPDCTGIEVLSCAKSKDEYTEVIVITGFASLDSATIAMNLGVYSYNEKPLSIPDFLIQIEKAIALRLFHLKSLMLMKHSDLMPTYAKDHLHDITQLYYFIRKLMLSIEVSEIMRITLEDINQIMGSSLAVIGVDLLGFNEIFAMPNSGVVEPDKMRSIISEHFACTFPMMKKELFEKELIPLIVYNGKQGQSDLVDNLYPVRIPMMVTDRSIGSLTLFFSKKEDFVYEQNQFLYVFTSIVSSIIEHGYSVLQARLQAKTDSLTGIANHRMFHETLEREIARSNRKGCSFSLILIDIDDFKKINDTYGHQVGDAVIIDLTRRISQIIRAGDVLARYGGEEFGIILSDTDLHGAEVLASRIISSFASKPLSYSHYQFSYTASLGVVVYDGNMPVKKDILISAADKALYDSKRNGKSQFTIGVVEE